MILTEKKALEILKNFIENNFDRKKYFHIETLIRQSYFNNNFNFSITDTGANIAWEGFLNKKIIKCYLASKDVIHYFSDCRYIGTNKHVAIVKAAMYFGIKNHQPLLRYESEDGELKYYIIGKTKLEEDTIEYNGDSWFMKLDFDSDGSVKDIDCHLK